VGARGESWVGTFDHSYKGESTPALCTKHPKLSSTSEVGGNAVRGRKEHRTVRRHRQPEDHEGQEEKSGGDFNKAVKRFGLGRH